MRVFIRDHLIDLGRPHNDAIVDTIRFQYLLSEEDDILFFLRSLNL